MGYSTRNRFETYTGCSETSTLPAAAGSSDFSASFSSLPTSATSVSSATTGAGRIPSFSGTQQPAAAWRADTVNSASSDAEAQYMPPAIDNVREPLQSNRLIHRYV